MAKPPTYNAQFLKRTSDQRNKMVARGRAVYSKDGRRLITPANPVEFTLAEYREWVIKTFGSELGAVPCPYECGAWITTLTFVLDHVKPINRGGLNRLDNFTGCCESCNDAKGELDGPWFSYLMRCLEVMPAGQAAIVMERLRKSEKAANSVRMLRGQLARTTKSPTEVPNARP